MQNPTCVRFPVRRASMNTEITSSKKGFTMAEANTIPSPPTTDAVPTAWRQFSHWLIEGWRLFCRAPFRLFGLLLLLFAVEMVVQIAIPLVGIPVSKLLVGMLSGVCWLALLQLHSCGRLRPLQAIGRVGNKWPPLVGLAFVQLLTYLVQVGVGRLVLGPGAVELLVLAQATNDEIAGEFQLGFILAAGVPLSTLVMFAAPLLLIERQSLGEALITSIRLCFRHALPISMLASLTMLLVFVAPASYLLPVLLLGPWLLCVGLVAYLDIGLRTKDVLCR